MAIVRNESTVVVLTPVGGLIMGPKPSQVNFVSSAVIDISERYIGIAKLLDVTAQGPAGSGMMHSKARRSCQLSMLHIAKN